jgi:threonine aldolase
MHFLSDNTAGVAPEILNALAKANVGREASYGGDKTTERLTRKFSDIFETEVVAFPVTTGTAANALSIATLTPPYGAVLCHEGAHIHVDECGAPEFYSGAKLVPIAGINGKITSEGLSAALDHFQMGFVHHVQPATVSITQATELGTVYAPPEIKALREVANRRGLKIHMDGSRFANAVAGGNHTPAELTWKSGVDVLSFGATKNGAMAAEAVIFFDKSLLKDFPYREKRAGHLPAKMRFISAQLEAMLDGGLWLDLAGKANAMSKRLSAGLSAIPGVAVVHPVQANEVFFTLPNHEVRKRLEAQGARFYLWSPPAVPVPLIRLVCSFATEAAEVDALLAAVRSSL